MLPYRRNYEMTRLPGKEEMALRLRDMDVAEALRLRDMDEPPDQDLDFFFREMVYPKFRRHAGVDKTADEVVRMLHFAIFECIVGVPQALADRAYDRIPLLIETLVDSKPVREEALMVFAVEKRERLASMAGGKYK